MTSAFNLEQNPALYDILFPAKRNEAQTRWKEVFDHAEISVEKYAATILAYAHQVSQQPIEGA